MQDFRIFGVPSKYVNSSFELKNFENGSEVTCKLLSYPVLSVHIILYKHVGELDIVCLQKHR